MKQPIKLDVTSFHFFPLYVHSETRKFHKDFLQFIPVTDLSKNGLPIEYKIEIDYFIQ